MNRIALAKELLKVAKLLSAAMGPFEFLKEFQRDWKFENTSLADVEKWSHAMGYSVPAGSKPFETSMAAGNIALAVMGLERIMKGEDHTWKTPEERERGIKYHNDEIKKNMIEALDDLYEFRRMRSEEADAMWVSNPNMRRQPYRRLKLTR
jgi:hypothetical protein